MSTLEANLKLITEQISQAAAISGRVAEDIELMAATKTVDRGTVDAAVGLGVLLFGENRVQEAAGKFDPKPTGIRLHMIGHLQRNKAKPAVELFDCIESIDKLETAVAVNMRCEETGHGMDILLEVNTSGEESKSGFRSDDEFFRSLDGILELPRIRVRGLMTIGPFTDDESDIRAAFSGLRGLFETAATRIGGSHFNTLSMGMSSDFIPAIEEGSTRIRVGSALFGARR